MEADPDEVRDAAERLASDVVALLKSRKGWRRHKKTPSAVVEIREETLASGEGSNISCFRVRGVVHNATPEQVIDSMWSWTVDQWQMYVDGSMSENETVWEIDEDVKVVRQASALPWPFKDRDFCLVQVRRYLELTGEEERSDLSCTTVQTETSDTLLEKEEEAVRKAIEESEKEAERRSLSAANVPTLRAGSEGVKDPRDTPEKEQRVRAAFAYQADNSKELSFEEGEEFALVPPYNIHVPGWWTGKKDSGKQGFFPSNFVTLVEQCVEPEVAKEAAVKTTADPRSSTDSLLTSSGGESFAKTLASVEVKSKSKKSHSGLFSKSKTKGKEKDQDEREKTSSVDENSAAMSLVGDTVPYSIMWRSVIVPHCPERKAFVRGRVLYSAYAARPVFGTNEDDKTTEVVRILQVEPRGMIPTKLISKSLSEISKIIDHLNEVWNKK